MTVLFGQEQVHRYRATDGEEGYIWREGSTIVLLMNEMWPHYDEYAEKTDREIPVVVLERV